MESEELKCMKQLFLSTEEIYKITSKIFHNYVSEHTIIKQGKPCKGKQWLKYYLRSLTIHISNISLVTSSFSLWVFPNCEQVMNGSWCSEEINKCGYHILFEER